LIKIESQNQEFEYTPQMANISDCGFFILFPVPPDDVLCAMKLSALLSRAKGRDFYDALFLLSSKYWVIFTTTTYRTLQLSKLLK